jgi:Tat protein secretion system quality control protein TatD with DNase activity
VKLNRLLLETDAPYLGLFPESLIDVAARVSQLRHKSVECIVANANANAKALYGF